MSTRVKQAIHEYDVVELTRPVTAAYKELASAIFTAPSGRGAKREAISQFIHGSTAGEFTVADVRRAVPTASDSYVDKTLAELRDGGLIEPVGTGRGARWRRRP